MQNVLVLAIFENCGIWNNNIVDNLEQFIQIKRLVRNISARFIRVLTFEFLYFPIVYYSLYLMIMQLNKVNITFLKWQYSE